MRFAEFQGVILRVTFSLKKSCLSSSGL